MMHGYYFNPACLPARLIISHGPARLIISHGPARHVASRLPRQRYDVAGEPAPPRCFS